MEPTTIYGNIIDLGLNGELDLILQGCNCQNTMGKGLGLELKQRIPQCYEEDCKTIKGDKNKLGTISYITIITPKNTELTIVNCYTQYWYGPKKGYTQTWTIKPIMEQIKQKWSGKKIGYPKIGCGLGQGDWNEIYPIIKETLWGEDQYLILLPE
jgi:O-acetyl-ADP-ribose deacetylase (regulator of RNase III)